MMLLIAAALAAVLADPAAFSPEFRLVARDRAADAREAFDRRLADYPSARFRDVQAVRNTDNPAPNIRFCGFVNVKNAYGAYVGWTRFLVMGSKISVEGDPSDDIEIEVICDSPTTSADTVDWSADLTFR